MDKKIQIEKVTKKEQLKLLVKKILVKKLTDPSLSKEMRDECSNKFKKLFGGQFKSQKVIKGKKVERKARSVRTISGGLPSLGKKR